jgi:diguanylate cyclase (GGDEF)-like protein
MTRPLKQLTLAAEQLASGNADVRCDCTTNDEIGRLATVFNDTSAKIKDYMTYINSLAYRDSLTGVKNRTSFIEAVASLNTKLRAHQTSFGILMADINGLKRANDIYGHEVGDRLIVDAIKVVCNVFKHSPVYRIGGDEFAVILEGHDLQNYKSLLRELDSAYLKAYVRLDNEKLPIMMAYGVAVFTAGLDRDVDDVINRADQQMYSHKRDFKRRNGE